MKKIRKINELIIEKKLRELAVQVTCHASCSLARKDAIHHPYRMTIILTF